MLYYRKDPNNILLYYCTQSHKNVTMLVNDNINLTGKRRNVEIKVHPKQGLKQDPLNLKSLTLPNELKRYPTCTVLHVVPAEVLVNPKAMISPSPNPSPTLGIFTLKIPLRSTLPRSIYLPLPGEDHCNKC